MGERLGFVDLLLIAEAVLGEPAERLQRQVSLRRIESALAIPFLSDGPVEVHPDPAERAAICCSLLVRNRLFPRGNREIAYLCMCEMLERGNISWSSSPQVEDEIDDVIKALESGTLNEEQFVFWVRSMVASQGGG